jgi:hypothetical protein
VVPDPVMPFGVEHEMTGHSTHEAFERAPTR